MSLPALVSLNACNSGSKPSETTDQGGDSTNRTIQVDPATMKQIGSVDERFQSYNVEMLEVTGGRFWKPYASLNDSSGQSQSPGKGGPTPTGMDPNLYEYRPPLDLGNQRLRRLAAALSPAYVRVSGTWANNTYFPPTDAAPGKPPTGFDGVLTHAQWKGVVNFANTVKADIITSFATGAGTRDKNNVWTDEQAKRWVAYTKSIGGRIAGAEYMNEPTVATMGGAPKGYTVQDYGRDFRLFRQFAKRTVPDMLILGPGSVGETTREGQSLTYGVAGTLGTEAMLKASGPGVDVFTHHFYGAVSRRCESVGMRGTTADNALTEEWLSRTDATLAFYKPLRDQYAPGKPIWNTETGETACGGNPWAATFLDTFRYVDQMGRLARQGVAVVMHNTLTASDYALLDEQDHSPRPSYWAALLWRQLMGTEVFDAGKSRAGTHVYAHSLRGKPGGITLLVINTAQTPVSVAMPTDAEQYTLTGNELQTKSVQLNGQALQLGTNDELPKLMGKAIRAGTVELPATSITFLTVADAGRK